MKEIGKLLELLNECTNGRFKSEDDLRLCIEMRGYCKNFIKWLVENDKIDIESYCRITSIERKGEKDVYRDEVDSLLMLLAIQDEPINFLLEILK